MFTIKIISKENHLESVRYGLDVNIYGWESPHFKDLVEQQLELEDSDEWRSLCKAYSGYMTWHHNGTICEYYIVDNEEVYVTDPSGNTVLSHRKPRHHEYTVQTEGILEQ